jgi:hypothetical protein
MLRIQQLVVSASLYLLPHSRTKSLIPVNFSIIDGDVMRDLCWNVNCSCTSPWIDGCLCGSHRKEEVGIAGKIFRRDVQGQPAAVVLKYMKGG